MVDSPNPHRSGVNPTLERDSEARRWFDRLAALVYVEVREDFRGLAGPPLNFAGSGCRQEGLLVSGNWVSSTWVLSAVHPQVSGSPWRCNRSSQVPRRHVVCFGFVKTGLLSE